ncbi:C2 domain-containing protein, partial [Catenaria anguillulae PL171]
LVGAYDLADKDHFTSQDPYLCVTVGNRTKQTGVHSRGGSHPTWNQCLTFRVTESQLDLESLHLECYDFDYFTKDDLIGVGGCSLREAKHGFDGWIELVKKCNRKAGRVHI